MGKPLYVKPEDEQEWEAYQEEQNDEQEWEAYQEEQNKVYLYVLKAHLTRVQAEKLSNWLQKEMIPIRPGFNFYRE